MASPSFSLESKPLTQDQAKNLLAIVNATPVQGDAVISCLSMRMALERIIAGYDVVKEAEDARPA